MKGHISTLTDGRFRWEARIVACMYFGYAASILCLSAFPIAAPAMLEDASLQLDKAIIGSMMAWGAGGAFVGKLLTGAAADRWGGRRVFFGALTVNAAATAAFGSASRLVLFKLFNFVALLARSAAWPAMATLIAAWFDSGKHGRVWGILSTSSRLGSALSTLLLGALLLVLPWRWTFAAGVAMTIVAVVVSLSWLKSEPADVGLPAPTGSAGIDAQSVASVGAITLGAALRLFVRSGRVWLICLAMVGLTLLMELGSFLPMFLRETVGLSEGHAGMASSAFPAGALIAVLLGGVLYDKLPESRRPAVFGGLVVLSGVSLAVLWAMPVFGLAPTTEVAVAIGLIFIVGGSIAPAYYVPMSVFAVRFGDTHRGMLIGLIDACGYAGATAYYFLAGRIAEDHGWGTFLALQVSISVVSALLITAFLRLECGNPTRSIGLLGGR